MKTLPEIRARFRIATLIKDRWTKALTVIRRSVSPATGINVGKLAERLPAGKRIAVSQGEGAQP